MRFSIPEETLLIICLETSGYNCSPLNSSLIFFATFFASKPALSLTITLEISLSLCELGCCIIRSYSFESRLAFSIVIKTELSKPIPVLLKRPAMTKG